MVLSLHLPQSAGPASQAESKSSVFTSSHSAMRTSATKTSTSEHLSSKAAASVTSFSKTSVVSIPSKLPFASGGQHFKAPASVEPTSKASVSDSLTSKVSSSTAQHSTPLPEPLSQKHIASAPTSLSQSISSSLTIAKAVQSVTPSTTPQPSTAAHSSASTTPPTTKTASISQSPSSAIKSSSSVFVTHQAGPISPSNTPTVSSAFPSSPTHSSAPIPSSSPTHSSAPIPSIVNGLQTSPGSSVTQEASSVSMSSHSSSAVLITGAPEGTSAADTFTTPPTSTNAFMTHKATAGGILAVAAIMILALVAAVVLFCRRKYGKIRAERHRRWRRGISWPASDSDGGYDPFFVTPRTAPAPPMTEMSRDAYISRSTVGSPMSAVQPNPFDRLSRPAPIATSAVLSQRMDTPVNGNFGYPFRTMYPDQPLDAAAGTDADKDEDETVRDHVSVHSPHRASPSLIHSSPSIYAISLPEEDADSLYAREAQTTRPADPFVDPQMLTSPSAFNVARKPVPPIPPRHRSRPSLTGVVVTPPVSDNGLGLTMTSTASQSEEYDNNMMTPTRRTFLNIRPKRGSNGASSAGEAV